MVLIQFFLQFKVQAVDLVQVVEHLQVLLDLVDLVVEEMDDVVQVLQEIQPANQETLLQQIQLKVLLVVTEVLQVDMVQVAVVEQLL